MAKTRVDLILGAKDKTKTAFASVKRGLGEVSRSNAAMAAAASAAAVAVAHAYASAAVEAGKFSRSMAEVRTMTQLSEQEHKKHAESIRRISEEYGQAKEAATKAAYDIASAGFSGLNENTALMEESARLAVAGVSDMGTTADLITTVLNAYSMGAEDARDVSNKLFGAVKGGKTTITELGASLGKVIPTAAVAGVELDELLAAMAAMTAGGIQTEEAANALNSLLSGLAAATPEARKKLDELGISLDEGLGPALIALAKQGEAGLGALKELLPNIRGMKAAASAGRDGGRAFAAGLQEVESGAKSAGYALDTMTDEAALKVDRLREKWKNFKIEMGNSALTILSWFSRDEPPEDPNREKYPWEEQGITEEAWRAADDAKYEEFQKRWAEDADPILQAIKDREEAERRVAIELAIQAEMLKEIKKLSGPKREYDLGAYDGDPEARRRMIDIEREQHRQRDLAENPLTDAEHADIQGSLIEGPLISPDELADLENVQSEFEEMESEGTQAFNTLASSFSSMAVSMLRDGGDIGSMLSSLLFQFLQMGLTSALTPGAGFLGLAQGGTIPAAAAGMTVPDGPRGLDSRLIRAMPGEEVVRRDRAVEWDRILRNLEQASILQPASGSGGEIHQHFQFPDTQAALARIGRETSDAQRRSLL